MATTSKPEPSAKTLAARRAVLAKIEKAQSILWEAVQAASPLDGWAEEEPRGPYYLIRDQANATHDLWHAVNNAPYPTAHDNEDG